MDIYQITSEELESVYDYVKVEVLKALVKENEARGDPVSICYPLLISSLLNVTTKFEGVTNDNINIQL